MKQKLFMFKNIVNSLNKLSQCVKTVIVFLTVILSSWAVQSQTANGIFYTFDFSSLTAANSTGTTAVRVYDANNTYMDTTGIMQITRGAGLSNGTVQAVASWCFQNLNENTEALAVTANDYVEFKMRRKSGFEFRIDSLIFQWQYQNGATTINFAVRSSADNYTATLATASQAAAGTNSSSNYFRNRTKMTFAKPIYSQDSITLRLYIWGAGSTNRDFRFSDSLATVSNDFTVWGRTTAVNSLMQAFDFSTSLGSEATRPTYTCDNTYIDTVGVLISRGAALTAQTTTAGSYGAGGINTASEANAISGNDYFEFQIKPKFGYEYSLDRIRLRYFAATGVTNYSVRSSQNNYASNIATGTLTQNVNSVEDIVIRGPGVSTITPLSTDSAITYRIYLWTTGTTALQFRFTDGTANNTFNYDIACYGKMTTALIPKSTLSAPGAVTTCLGGGISLKTSNVGGTPPFTIWLKDNLGNQRVHTQTQSDSTFVIFPQSNRTYTLDSVKDVMGHKADSLAGTISVTVTNSPVISSPGTTIARTLNHLDGYTLTYASGDSCKSWVKIQDSVGGTTLGSTTCTARVLDTLPINNTSRRFIARRVDVAPTNNGIATVTLFYTQAEFNAFNAATSYQVKLPVSSTDTANVNSELIVRRTSNSIEMDSITSFSPSSVVWNQTNSQWEVSFRVNDGILNGKYYLSTPFNSTKMVSSITHTASPAVQGQTLASVTIDWNDVPGVTQYRIRIRPLNGNWNVHTVTGSQRISSLAFNTTYEVQVRVYEGVNTQGEYTNTYTFTTPNEPAKLPNCLAPTGNVTLNSPVSATISWTGVSNGANYIVEMRALNSLVWGGTSTTGNSVTFNALTPGATYEYRIRTTCLSGYTATGTSPFSSVATFTTAAISPCGVVGNLTTVSTTANSATVSWNPVGFATSYQVEVRLKNTAIWGGSSTTSTSVTFNNLSSGSNYEYRVRAYCNNAPVVTSTTIGLFSNIAEFTTASTPALGICLPPTNIIATPTANSVTVTWDSASYASGYFINIKQANAASWGGNVVNGLTRTFNALSPSTNYQIRIRTSCTPGTTTSNNSVFSDTVLFATTALANKAIFGTDEMPSYNVYPNPTRDNLHIDFTSPSTETVRIDVRDMTGRLIQTQRIDPMVGANSFDVDLKSAADGLYLIHIYQGSALRFMNKIQKTH